MKGKITLAATQTTSRTYVCIGGTATDLAEICDKLPIKPYISTLGKNGFMIDFPAKVKSVIKILTKINGRPLAGAAIEPINPIYF